MVYLKVSLLIKSFLSVMKLLSHKGIKYHRIWTPNSSFMTEFWLRNQLMMNWWKGFNWKNWKMVRTSTLLILFFFQPDYKVFNCIFFFCIDYIILTFVPIYLLGRRIFIYFLQGLQQNILRTFSRLTKELLHNLSSINSISCTVKSYSIGNIIRQNVLSCWPQTCKLWIRKLHLSNLTAHVFGSYRYEDEIANYVTLQSRNWEEAKKPNHGKKDH